MSGIWERGFLDALENQESYHIKASPGMGKSREIREYIPVIQSMGQKIVVVMPLHELIDEFFKYNPNLAGDSVHLLGKIRAGCKTYGNAIRAGFTEEEAQERCYLGGCKDCVNADTCMYIELMEEAFKPRTQGGKTAVFMVPHHMVFVPRIAPYLLVVDESMESLYMQEQSLEPWMKQFLEMERITCDKCLARCSWHGNVETCPHGLKNIKFAKLKSFEPETLRQYFFNLALERADGILCDNKRIFHDYNIMELVDDVPCIFFNCATTPTDFAEQMFGRNLTLKEITLPMKNQVYVFDMLGTVKETWEMLPTLPKFFTEHRVPADDRTLVICKKGLEDEIKKLLPGVEIEHYGQARGKNKYAKCEQVVIYGRFAYREHHVQVFHALTGLDIDKLAESEMRQALNRIRPLLDPSKKIWIFTNRIKIPITHKVRSGALPVFYELMKHRDEIDGKMTRSGVYELIGGRRNNVSAGITHAVNVGRIKKPKRGGVLEYI